MSIRILDIKQVARAVHCARHYSTNTASNVEKKLIYTSPNVGLVKLVKKFSLSTLGISAVATPTVMYFWQSPAVQAADMNSSMFIGAVMASACSTGALSFLLSPYVNSIHLHVPKQPGDNSSKKLPAISPNSTISIDTLDLFARRRTTTLQLKDLKPVASSSFMTWTVNKRVLEKQYALEQAKGIKPMINQHRFWLDQRNGMGDRDAMSSILRIVHEQGRQRMI
ncbi:hypothetical protein HMPREF1544_08500 [Mucor circinelloides 1006PhL]|uniref:Uncharacterized protein n=1 Tax=Mucor circinelloides f. circinelloides (strain 1006PhL) TaxID=1220926 RepID=S2JQ80_MUCC1|nr:hypothetical protein HMPREF1544_08500 [Mucor circinelloides 1006PhL]